MCEQPVIYPESRPMLSTRQLGWLPVSYYIQQQSTRKARYMNFLESSPNQCFAEQSHLGEFTVQII